jgi:hypothetical protein
MDQKITLGRFIVDRFPMLTYARTPARSSGLPGEGLCLFLPRLKAKSVKVRPERIDCAVVSC